MVLSRFSEGGIDPFTTIIGQLVCREFKLGRDGTHLFIKILDGLTCKSALGNVMHFGFGIDSIVRNLSASYEGGVLVLLCAALAECYYETHAADILWELVQCSKPKDAGDRTPSPTQWLALVRQCAGVLATDEFPVVAEHFMHLHPKNQLVTSESPYAENSGRRGVCSSESMAMAILALGKVSKGQLESITITGTADAGWLAALAHRFFNLRLAIYGPDGDLLFSNLQPHERPQVEILYERKSDGGSAMELKVPSQMYRLEDMSVFFKRQDGDYGSALSCGRVPWERSLSLTFGRDFHRLNRSTEFGTAIGAAARMYDLVFDTLDTPYVKAIVLNHCSSGRGQGLISFAVLRFPELLPHQPHMENIGSSLAETQNLYRSSVQKIEKLCYCVRCRGGWTTATTAVRFCLVNLTGAIINLLRTLSAVSVPDDLRPTRAGLEWYYKRQANIVNDKLCDSTFPLSGLGYSESLEKLLVDTTRIFSAREVTSTRNEMSANSVRSAISVAGICVFLEFLTDISCHPETLGRCAVIPGKIEMGGRNYDVVEDINEFTRGRYETSKPPDPPCSSPSDLNAGYETASFIARPTIKCVQLGLLAKHPSHESGPHGPTFLVESILQTFGLVQCMHTPAQGPFLSYYVKQVEVENSKPIWLYQGSLTSKMVAVVRTRTNLLDYTFIWRHDECLECCQKATVPKKSTLIYL